MVHEGSPTRLYFSPPEDPPPSGEVRTVPNEVAPENERETLRKGDTQKTIYLDPLAPSSAPPPPPPPFYGDFKIPPQTLDLLRGTIEELRREYMETLRVELVAGRGTFETICRTELISALCESESGTVNLSQLRAMILENYSLPSQDLPLENAAQYLRRACKRYEHQLKEGITISSDQTRAYLVEKLACVETYLRQVFKEEVAKKESKAQKGESSSDPSYEDCIMQIYGADELTSQEAVIAELTEGHSVTEQMSIERDVRTIIEVLDLKYKILMVRALIDSKGGCSRNDLKNVVTDYFDGEINDHAFDEAFNAVWTMCDELEAEHHQG